MEKLTVYQEQSETSHEFEGCDELVGTAHGIVYQDSVEIAWYFARWFPGTKRDLELLVTQGLSLQNLKSSYSIGIRCPYGDIDKIEIVDANTLPWDEDRIMIHHLCTKKEAISTGPTYGEKTLKIARAIINEDTDINAFYYGWDSV